MIYLILSCPFILLFLFQIKILDLVKKWKILSSFLQILAGPIIIISFVGPIFVSMYIKDPEIAKGVRWYSSSIVFICNMIYIFIYLIRHNKKIF